MSTFALSEEHEALREAVRALADDKIAPRAADIDRTAEFPWDVYEALVKADFHAVHIPEAYGGAGGDALAAALVIEEVARACATSSLIPAVNKLGTMPLLLGASEEVKQRYLPPVARGEGMFSYALSEPEAGSDAAAMRTRAVRTSGGYVLNGVKRWITNAGVSKFYTVMAVTDPESARDPNRPPDETGLVAAGVSEARQGFVLADISAVLAPAEWAKKAVRLARLVGATEIAYEKNQGGDLVRDTLRQYLDHFPELGTEPIRLVAETMGMAYTAIPVAGGFSHAQIDEMRAALDAATGPVLAFCRSGTRSTNLWALAEAKTGGDADTIVAKAAAAGYDLAGLRPTLEALAKA